MQMKKLVVAGCAALALCAVNAETDPAAGAVLIVDQVTQRYPWNGLVDIDYTISFAPGVSPSINDNLEVMMVDRAVSPAVTNRALTFLQAPLPMAEGSHRITWDANADGVTNRTDQAEIRIAFVHYAEAYMVIDVSGGSETNCYPVDFLNGAPPNEFSADEYRGNKIVLRRINPGSYVAGSPDKPVKEYGRTDEREVQHRVMLTKPFYIGIFEVTQQQYENVMGKGANNSAYKGPYRPVEKVSYNTIRGQADTATHQYDWPWTGEVADASFMGRLRSKCKSKDASGEYKVAVDGFDLPTEFQWEYACRAGTTGAYSTAMVYDNSEAGCQKAMAELGRCSSNTKDKRGGEYQQHTTVGSYDSNAWGLYDMHGNVWEWCLDWHITAVQTLKQFVDPKGPDNGDQQFVVGGERIKRGGCWYHPDKNARSGQRASDMSSVESDRLGFRLVRMLP